MELRGPAPGRTHVTYSTLAYARFLEKVSRGVTDEIAPFFAQVFEGEPSATDAALAPTGQAVAVVSAGEQARFASAVAEARAPNTRRAYAGQWARFEAWCRARGAAALPAAPVLVAAYLTERAETARISTVRVAAAAIGAAHRARGAADPTAAASVRAVVAGIARQHAARPDAAPRQAAPFSLESAVLLLALAQQPRRTGRGVESARVAAARGLEDGAIVSLAFCAGLRRSEIAALRWQDVRTLTEITLLCAERPKPQKTGSAWMHLATLYRSRS